MVNAIQHTVMDGMRWSFYLMLSLAMLLFSIGLADWNKSSPQRLSIEPIKLNFVSLAAPKAALKSVSPVKEQSAVSEVEAVRQSPLRQVVPPVMKSQKLETKTEARKTIAPYVPASPPAPRAPIRPVVAKPAIQDSPQKEMPKPVVEEAMAQQNLAFKSVLETVPDSISKSNSEAIDQKPEIVKGPGLEKKKQPQTDNNKGRAETTLIQEAKYRRRVPPRYPRRALDLGQQGLVTIHARLNLDGSAENFKIAESSGYRLLDRSALAAVKKWEFEPITIDGTPTTGWVRVPVNFVIQ